MRGWGVVLGAEEVVVVGIGAGVEFEVVAVGFLVEEIGVGELGIRGWKSKMDVELWVRRWPLRWWVEV